MTPTFISLFYFGLSLGQTMEAQNGSLSKPLLQVLPAPVVAPGEDVTFQCSISPHSYPKAITFFLQKGQNSQLLQNKTGEGTRVDFSLYSVRTKDAGNYTCTYHETTGSYRVSEPSETLELWVTGILPKPNLSAAPSQPVVSEANVTLLCWGPIRGVRFALYKQGEENFVSIRDSIQNGAEFPFSHVSINNMGNYSCRYYLGPNSTVLTPPSDLLELTVQSEQDIPSQHSGSRNILIILSCIFILCLLLLAFLGHQCTKTVTSHGQIPRRSPECLCLPQNTCFSSKPASPQEEPVYAQTNKWRPREMTVPEDEHLQEIIYIQLNKSTWNESQTTIPPKAPLEPTLYATVAIHCGAERNLSVKNEPVIQNQRRKSNQN
ncbi:T-cell-interacting, activating receptor on myeloid cells protein 1-like [Notamacropus eugenii]|uniref:T-cell-interacting, activating receptor on myeloid cells protein 1-like n=1 Tax=Notamacropus eugenii TaxID=9315 RepID=UPI003B67FF32